MSQNFQYETTFTDNILVLGQTGCGKMSFVQSLGKNKIFGSNSLGVDWVSKINLTKIREDEIRQRFTYTNVDFYYPNDVEELNLLIETFQKETYDEDEKADSDSKIYGDGCNIFGENKKFGKLIVMGDVSGLADKSNDFANFLSQSKIWLYFSVYLPYYLSDKISLADDLISD